jgi:release factor glutamine methyltransferase
VTDAPLRPALNGWTAHLRRAGVPSAAHDARALAAFVLGVPPLQVALVPAVGEDQRRQVAELIRRRAAREPLQHILGTAGFYGLELRVGPGVFVPRPETELMADSAVRWLLERPGPQTVVDLCSGSGALALALACSVPAAAVTGVEASAAALEYARDNLAHCRGRIVAGSVSFLLADACAPDVLVELSGAVDAVVANPPYIPLAAVPREREVSQFDPPQALYGGEDGLDVIRGILPVARRLLRPGGLLAIEHSDLQGGADGVPGLLAASGSGFESVADHDDLAGRPRFATAHRLG